MRVARVNGISRFPCAGQTGFEIGVVYLQKIALFLRAEIRSSPRSQQAGKLRIRSGNPDDNGGDRRGFWSGPPSAHLSDSEMRFWCFMQVLTKIRAHLGDVSVRQNAWNQEPTISIKIVLLFFGLGQSQGYRQR